MKKYLFIFILFIAANSFAQNLFINGENKLPRINTLIHNYNVSHGGTNISTSNLTFTVTARTNGETSTGEIYAAGDTILQIFNAYYSTTNINALMYSLNYVDVVPVWLKWKDEINNLNVSTLIGYPGKTQINCTPFLLQGKYYYWGDPILINKE